jgi:hypothetical protein
MLLIGTTRDRGVNCCLPCSQHRAPVCLLCSYPAACYTPLAFGGYLLASMVFL